VGKVVDCLKGFTPKPGDAVFLPGGTVHSMGGDLLVFEVQQNNDVTYRLFDWGHVDSRTGQTRELQIEQGLASIDFSGAAIGLKVPGMVGTSVDQVIACMDFEARPAGLVVPSREPASESWAPATLTIVESTGGVIAPAVAAGPPVLREELFQCEYFFTCRSSGQVPFSVGTDGAMRVLVCTEGAGQLEHLGECYAMAKGDVLLLPAAVGACVFRPMDDVQLLEIGVPE
jgi:mannose-6-phosphate isomerase